MGYFSNKILYKTGRVDCQCGDQIISNSGKVMSKNFGMIVCWNPKCGRVYSYDAVEKVRKDKEVVIFHPPGKDLKVFKMNDCDWWMDYDLINAILNYSEFIMIPSEESTDETYQLSFKGLKDLKYHNDDNGYTCSFLDELQRRQSTSDSPDFFASTEF